MAKILFVCLGNICRSPTAQGVFEQIAAQRRVLDRFEVDSAGTSAWHIGKPPDRRAQKAALQRGFDLSALRARQVSDRDYGYFDYILAMDEANLREMQDQCPPEYQHKLSLFLDYSATNESEVPDPYYGGDDGFDHVLDLVESASSGLIDYALSDEQL